MIAPLPGFGLITFGLANTALVLALLRGNDVGWTSPGIIGLFVTTALLFAASLLIESRVAQPMLPMKFFRSPTFAGAQITAFAISATMFASFLYIILYAEFSRVFADGCRPALSPGHHRVVPSRAARTSKLDTIETMLNEEPGR